MSVNTKGVVITTDSGAIVDGSHVAPSNAEGEGAGYYNIFLNAISDSNLAVGGVRGDVTSNAAPHAFTWAVGADNPYVPLDFTGTGVAASDRTAAYLVSSDGQVAGTDYDSGANFYWTSPTAKASKVTDPANPAIAGRIVQLSDQYRVIQTYENNATVYYQVTQSSGEYTKLASLADSSISKAAPVTALSFSQAANYDLVAMYRGETKATDLNQATGLNIQSNFTPVPASNGDIPVTVDTGSAPYPVYIITHASQNPPPVVNSTGDTGAINDGAKGCDTGKTVTVNGQSAPECTLRAAIQAENAGSVTAKSITFALPTGSGAIAPGEPLPALKADGVTIDGTTGPGGLMVVNGTALDQGQPVLHLSGGSDTVAGVVPELATIGVLIDSKAGHDTVRACPIGVASPSSPAGTQITLGVKVLNSPSATIGGTTAADGNVLSGLGLAVLIDGAGSRGAVVAGNYVGTDAAGDSEPDGSGVEVLDASGAQIGGPASAPGAAPGNVFDGSTSGGTLSEDGSAAIAVIGVASAVSSTVVQGNLIGVNPDGTTAAPSHFKFGVLVGGRTSGTLIGGTRAGAGNVIAQASSAQVTVTGTSTSGTQVLGNLSGTDASGMHVIGGSVGVRVDAASATTIGTPGAGRNVIAGGQSGVLTSATSSPLTPGGITGPGGHTPAPGTDKVTRKSAMSTIVSGNIIGPLADGSTVDAEHVIHTGVALAGIGETLGPNNQIAFTDTAVNVAGSAETVYGNLIGTNPDGTNPIPNGVGVFVAAGKGVKSTTSTGVPTVRIGVPGQKANVISGNTDDLFTPSPALVRNNLIGTVANGLSAMPAYTGPALPDTIIDGAGYGGVLALVGGAGSVIGGTQPGFGNVISGGPTASGAVQATGGLGIGASHVTVQGNDIGVGSDGVTAVPNAGYGIRVASGGSDVIGAPTPGGHGTTTSAGGNVIANNGGGGVVVAKDVAGVSILSNQIHDNTGAGIGLTGDTSNNDISAPSITAAAQDAANTGVAIDRTVVIGRASAPSQPVQIYTATNCAADGSPGQGAAVLATALTDKHGDFSVAVPIQPVGSQLDATYTDTRGTSTFSGCIPVAPAANGTVMQPTGKPGDPNTANGTGFTPGEPVQGSVHSTPVTLGTHTADSNGDVSFAFHIPAGLEAGPHYVLLTGQTSGNTVAIPLTVFTAPGTPRDVVAHAGKHQVTLSWAAPADTGGKTITGYRIQRSAGHGYTTLHTVTTRAYTDRTVTGGHTYHYRLEAINSIGASPDSNTAGATPYTPPSAPRAVHAKTGHDSITVTWHAPAHTNGAPVISYRVQYATCTLGAHGCHPHTVTRHTRHVEITHLNPDRTYHLRVVATNRAGTGTPSPQTQAKPER